MYINETKSGEREREKSTYLADLRAELKDAY